MTDAQGVILITICVFTAGAIGGAIGMAVLMTVTIVRGLREDLNAINDRLTDLIEGGGDEPTRQS